MKKAISIILAIMFLFAFASVAHAQITKDQYYARSTLEGKELEFYDAAYDYFARIQTKADWDNYGISKDEYGRYWSYVHNDAPELIHDIFFTKEQNAQHQNLIDLKTNEILSLLADDMTDYEKVKTIYYYLAKNTEYGESDAAMDNGHTILGALVYGKAVCDGLASALQYLLYKIDIPCYRVTSETHAWNIIKIDGQWYYADITFDQPDIQNGENELNWFLRGDNFYDIHENLDMSGNPPLPECPNDYVEPHEPGKDLGQWGGWIIIATVIVVVAVIAVRNRPAD